VRNIVACIAAVLIFLAPIRATEDRACPTGDFQLVAMPRKAVFSRAEEVAFPLTATNRTQRDVWIVPHLFPFDYSVERLSRGRWKEMGGMVPAARSRQIMPLGRVISLNTECSNLPKRIPHRLSLRRSC
jgi:hypothetical protein